MSDTTKYRIQIRSGDHEAGEEADLLLDHTKTTYTSTDLEDIESKLERLKAEARMGTLKVHIERVTTIETTDTL